MISQMLQPTEQEAQALTQRKLEQFREKIKRGKFPDQETFTWQRLGSSVDRYFNKEMPGADPYA